MAMLIGCLIVHILIIIPFLIIFRSLNRKFPIREDFLMFNITSYIVVSIIFAIIFMILFPYNSSSEEYNELEDESNILINSAAGAFFGGLITILIHFLIYFFYFKKKQDNKNGKKLNRSNSPNEKTHLDRTRSR